MTDNLTDDRRCTASTKSTGARCKRAAIPGGTVCVKHGGGAPQVRAAAEERLLVAAADRAVRDLWVGLDQAAPVTDPVASMQRLAGALEQLVDEAGRRVSTMKRIAGGEHLTQLRAEVTLFERSLGHLSTHLDRMARLGIAERHVELEQERASMVTAAFLTAIEVLALLPEDRTRVVERFLAGLGQVVPGEVA